MLDWIWPYIQPHLDPDQMGGRPGCSVEHYIIKMVQFILSSIDGNSNQAVNAVPVDYSKAFNRMKHSNILIHLIALNVPKCAVKLIKSYLTKRSMCVRFHGAVSSFHSCPGGGPQGGLLTGVLFFLRINKAGSPCVMSLPPSLGQEDTYGPPNIPQVHSSHPSHRQEEAEDRALLPIPQQEMPPCHNQSKLHKKAYVDDLTMLERISLSSLITKERIIGPLNWHDRFNLTLPPESFILQHHLSDLTKFTENNFMRLNKSKTKCFPFISSITKDFMPQLSLEEGSFLEVIYQLKLVGLVLTSDFNIMECPRGLYY